MRPSHGQDENLDRILSEQLDSAEAMLALLDREHRALLDGDAENLNRASADKARLVDDLEALERARHDLAGSAADARGPAAQRWQKLLTTIEECRMRNLRNGALANARREQVVLALNVLRGGESGLYDAHGSVARPPGARPLGEA
jgi:flagellar biosynthesis/type III secretory pathway chaperone